MRLIWPVAILASMALTTGAGMRWSVEFMAPILNPIFGS